MSKIPIELVAAAMKQAHVDPAKLREVIELINSEIAAQEKDEGEKQPAPKRQFVILTPPTESPGADKIGWIIQIEESEHPMTAVDKIVNAASTFNTSKRGRMLPVKTVGEAIENVSAKIFKEHGVWIKTKLPVTVCSSSNTIRFPDEQN